MRNEMRIAGFGGQGIISMGVIISNAIGKYDGKEVAQTQSYGPEARGGACKTEIVIDDLEIDYIKVQKPDVFIAMSQPALDKYISDLDPEKSVLLVDNTLITSIPSNIKNVYKVPATQIADEQLKLRLTANVVMLGSFVGLSNMVTYEACKKALEDNIPPKFLNENLAAYKLGYDYAKQLVQEGMVK